ncbi:nucleolar complex protein 2 homolog [Caerostris darwini]|uniref:Nucleolar complex protein 2 homolog n=1 Tax=Caerostris darwini TaxID=1538125 RepID=A0AAV4R281_9ARAC|nr:nucleolar complex protein 2 homolog [Caerostris darwini]
MSSSESEMDDSATHAAAMKRLKFKDPDFYQFLQENEKDLLNFNEDNEELSADDEEEEKVEKEEEKTEKISPQKLAYIKQQIREAPTLKLVKTLTSAFKSVVNQAEGSSKKVDMSNSEFFNDVIKLCLVDLVPAFHKVLHISADEGKKKLDPTKSKMWTKVKMTVKSYLIDMLKMISSIKESSMLVLLLKHIVHLVPFYSAFIKLLRNLLKKMVSLWSSEEETVRVLSLIVIVRSTKLLSKEYLGQVLKEMYFAYIKNTKFTSATTWPLINFMKRSLSEVYALNPEMAYEHGFIYIRQMSIHLRNAITTKKKEAFQTVYNWQYTHCILLWSHLLCRLADHEPIKTLFYPLVQTTIGALNLIPTAKYVPLRFHLVKALMYISKSTEIFIPVLPFILDVLKIVDYNRKSNFSVKPVEFSCALKVTKSQLLEAGFKDSCIAEVCSLLVEYLQSYSNTIGFPELALPAVLQIKSFMKQCKIAKYNQQLKTVLSKINENSLLISEKRRLVTFSITDNDQIKKWEEDILSAGTPLLQIKKEKQVKKYVEQKPLNKKRKLSK